MPAPPSARLRGFAPSRRRRLVAAALVALLGVGLWLRVDAAQQAAVAPTILLNPCNGEVIAMRDSSHLLPFVASGQPGSREASVNASGLSGVGSQGHYYLPMGTGKVVLTLGSRGIDLAVGGDLELVARAGQSPDFRLHGIGHLKLSAADGFRGSGLTLRSRCGP